MMGKNIKWLKEAVGELNLVVTEFEADGMCYMDRAVSVTQVYDLIDQLDESEVEEELLYHALIKGHDVSNSDDIYWNYDKYDNDVFVSRLYPSHDNFLTEMSKSEWNKLGINDSNADFVKVDK